MFSRQHYKAIADIIHYAERYHNSKGVEVIQKSSCEYFANDNPRFDKDKFNKACKG